jgi:hypothetical protein
LTPLYFQHINKGHMSNRNQSKTAVARHERARKRAANERDEKRQVDKREANAGKVPIDFRYTSIMCAALTTAAKNRKTLGLRAPTLATLNMSVKDFETSDPSNATEAVKMVSLDRGQLRRAAQLAKLRPRTRMRQAGLRYSHESRTWEQVNKPTSDWTPRTRELVYMNRAGIVDPGPELNSIEDNFPTMEPAE